MAEGGSFDWDADMFNESTKKVVGALFAQLCLIGPFTRSKARRPIRARQRASSARIRLPLATRPVIL